MPDPTQEECDRMRKKDERMDAQEMEAAHRDAMREMLGDDADYFEAAGIDDIGAK